MLRSTCCALLAAAALTLLSSAQSLAQDLWTDERRAAIVSVRAFKSAQQQPEHGTGFLVSNTGFMLTAAHVVRGASRVEISLFGPGGPWMAVADKPQEDLGEDVALLKAFTSSTPNAYRPLPVGDSSTVQRSDVLYFAGFPFARDLDTRRVEVTSLSGISGGFQGDANAAQGFSGAPVINRLGTVVAVLTSGASTVPGFLQLVPVSRIRAGLDRYDIRVAPATAASAIPQKNDVAAAPPVGPQSTLPRITSYAPPPPLPRSSGKFDGRNWRFDIFHCEHGEGDARLAREYAYRIEQVLRSQDNISRLRVQPWPAPQTSDPTGTYVYDVYYDFDIRVTNVRMPVAIPLKALLDPIVRPLNAKFEFTEVGSEFPQYISMVICPRSDRSHR